MSYNISLDIQQEIIKKLPVKSLIQFRSVSKPWKSFIDSSRFIATYSHSHAQPQHLLIRYKNPVEIKGKYVCFVDDHTFPHQKFTPTLPHHIEMLHKSRILGTSHGLLCLYGHYLFPDNSSKKGIAVLWNPSIRKSVAIAVPDVKHGTVFGFGVCPVTLDPKIVRITQNSSGWQVKSKTTIPWQVQVYTLSSREWRSVSRNLPRQTIEVRWDQVVVNRFIYWHAIDKIDINGGLLYYGSIISFDMITDECREVDLPECLAHQHGLAMSISKVSESLVVLEYNEMVGCGIWMMEYGASNSFTKLFTIKLPHLVMNILGFRKSGEAIIEMLDDEEDYVPLKARARASLFVYEPHSEHINNIGLSGIFERFSVNFYTESLLLLNQSDTMTAFQDVELVL